MALLPSPLPKYGLKPGEYDFSKIKTALSLKDSKLPEIVLTEPGKYIFRDMERTVFGLDFLSGAGRKAYAQKGIEIVIHNCRLKPDPETESVRFVNAPHVFNSGRMGPTGGINALSITNCEFNGMGGIRNKQMRRHPETGRCARLYVAFNIANHIDGRVRDGKGGYLTWHQAAALANQEKWQGRTDYKPNMFNSSWVKIRRGEFKGEVIDETEAVLIEWNIVNQIVDGLALGNQGDVHNIAYPATDETLVRDEHGRVISSGIVVRDNLLNGPYMLDPLTQDCPATLVIADPGADGWGAANVAVLHNYGLGGSNMLFQAAHKQGSTYWGWNTAANHHILPGTDKEIHYVSGGFGHLLYATGKPEFYNNRSYCVRRRVQLADGKISKRRNDFIIGKGNFDKNSMPFTGERANVSLWTEDSMTKLERIELLRAEAQYKIEQSGHTVGTLSGTPDIPAQITIDKAQKDMEKEPAYFPPNGNPLVFEQFETMPDYPISSTSKLISVGNGALKSVIPISLGENHYRDEISFNRPELEVENGKLYNFTFAVNPWGHEEFMGAASIVFQLHTSTLGQNVNPPLALKLENLEWKLDLRGDSRPFGQFVKPEYEELRSLKLGPVSPYKWEAFNITVKTGENGFVSIQRGAQKPIKVEMEHFGFNTDNMYAKIGQYASLLQSEKKRAEALNGEDYAERIVFHAFYAMGVMDAPEPDKPVQEPAIIVEEDPDPAIVALMQQYNDEEEREGGIYQGIANEIRQQIALNQASWGKIADLLEDL